MTKVVADFFFPLPYKNNCSCFFLICGHNQTFLFLTVTFDSSIERTLTILLKLLEIFLKTYFPREESIYAEGATF
jgi:hypothetical protein